jgi:hypothetical protein
MVLLSNALSAMSAANSKFCDQRLNADAIMTLARTTNEVDRLPRASTGITIFAVRFANCLIWSSPFAPSELDGCAVDDRIFKVWITPPVSRSFQKPH